MLFCGSLFSLVAAPVYLAGSGVLANTRARTFVAITNRMMWGSTGRTLGSFSIVSSTARGVSGRAPTCLEALANVEDVLGTADLLNLARLLLEELDEGLVELLQLARYRPFALLVGVHRGGAP